MSYAVKAEKIIKREVADVFNALKEGRLLLNCGSDTDVQMDFRVGGKYKAEFRRYNFAQSGEFLEIVENKKVVFSWCQSPGADRSLSTPDTLVTIELFPVGETTKLVLVHAGFATQANADNHQQGWNGGIGDFAMELQEGRLRMVRGLKASVEKVFDFCTNPQNLFVSQGTIIESEPHKKIIVSWSEGKVTLMFEKKDPNGTRLELVHEGLNLSKNPMSHRKDWEAVTQKMSEI